MTSELERQDGYSWFAPRFEKLAILGQLNGPSIDLVRVAKAARFEFKIEEAKRKAERASLSAVTPYAASGGVHHLHVRRRAPSSVVRPEADVCRPGRRPPVLRN